MFNQFFYSFSTYHHRVGETYLLEDRKYLVTVIFRNNVAFLNHTFPVLLIPDDNSLLANSIRYNPEGFFKIPFSNLKFLPRVLKWGNEDALRSAFLVKDTNQVQKITETEINPFQVLTFKVRNQEKKNSPNNDPRCYENWLEIEPFRLIEGLPEISKIKFGFDYTLSLERSCGSLIKSSLYNHPMLNESAGKTFTLRFKSLVVCGERDDGEGNDNVLLFHSSEDFEVDKFLSENYSKNGSNNNNPTPNQPGNSPSPKGLLIFIFSLIIVVFLIVIGTMIWRKLICKNK